MFVLWEARDYRALLTGNGRWVNSVAQFLKIDFITRDPPHDSDENYNPVEGFV